MAETKMTAREYAEKVDNDLALASDSVCQFAEAYVRDLLSQRMSELSSRWDLNDFPDDQRPANASEANVAYCELLSLLKSLPSEK